MPAGRQLSTENGGNSGTGNTHLREAKKTENQDWIHDQVDNGTQRLRNHCVNGFTSRLEKSLHSHLHKEEDGAGANHCHVLNTVMYDLSVACRLFIKVCWKEKTNQQENDAGYNFQENTIHGQPY